MKIISPDGKQYNSLQSAFSHISHSTVEDAVRLVESFLKGLGSCQYASSPSHFLVGKDFCIDFSNGSGSRVTMFGRIIACMKSSSTPSPEISKDDSFFILQYCQDSLDVARSTETHVPPLQLISSETAWGGCTAFERKTICTPYPKGVITKIDQATAVRKTAI
jgi:hypothetical protein